MAKEIHTIINESPKELKELIRSEPNSKKNVRLRALYLIQTGQVRYKSKLADLLGYNRTSIREWLEKYEEGGIEAMLDIGTSPGRTPHITDEIAEDLTLVLEEKPEAFDNYGQILDYVKNKFGMELPYNTLHRFVHYKLGVRIKDLKFQKRQKVKKEKIINI